MLLVTIPFSHFCEKARWGLDYAGVRYRELKFAPVFQRLAVLPLGSATVPVLVDAPRVVRGSSEILRWCDARLPVGERLFPAGAARRAEVERLVARFDAVIAPQIRLWFYARVTQSDSLLTRFAERGIGRAQRAVLRAALPAVRRALVMHFAIDGESSERAREAVDAEFAFVSELLGDGREFLVGDRFTAADLAFAAFTGGFLGAASYGGDGFEPPPPPAELREQSERWAATPAGRAVLRHYAERRHRPATRDG